MITLAPILSLFDYKFITDAQQQYSYTTKTFEELNFSYGYLLYETRIPIDVPDVASLNLTGLRDRAIIYLDHVRSIKRNISII